MVQGLFIRRISRRPAEVEVSGNTFEAYISNGIEMDFLKNESVCFLRKAGNENRRFPFDLYSVYDGDTLVCVDTKEPLRIAEIWASNNLNNERSEKLSFYTDTKGMTLLAPYFADLLDEVKEAGIPIEAVRCVVDEDGMTIDSIVPLR